MSSGNVVRRAVFPAFDHSLSEHHNQNKPRSAVLRLCCVDCAGLNGKARYLKGLENIERNTEFAKRTKSKLQETLYLQA
jgi:hypothetical protein